MTPRGTDIEVLHRARAVPAVPVVGPPEQPRPAQRIVRVRDDLADRVADAVCVPRLLGQRLERLGPVKHAA